MNLSPAEIAREASATGFPAETLEKVFRLMSLLDGLNAHPFLKRRIALKGGTALNLRADLAPARGQIAEWTDKLVSDCRGLLSAVLPLTPDEAEFIRRLNDTGDIAPDLLTGDAAVQANIHNHPGLRWKAVNVEKHFGASDDGTT